MFSKRLITTVLVIIALVQYSTAQNNTRMQFYPASENNLAGVLIYSTTTSKCAHYHAKNNEWVTNTTIKAPVFSVKGLNYRMQYIQEDENTFPGLFVYSAESGEFQFFYLENGIWKENKFLPKGKVAMNSTDVRIDFLPATSKDTAYVSAYSTDGLELAILTVQNGNWKDAAYFPN